MRRLPIVLFVVAAGASVAFGLHVLWQDGRRATVPDGHVYTGCAEEPSDVNPFTTRGLAARRLVVLNTHEPLLDVDPATGELRPCVAEAFELSPDRTKCTFTLRKGLRFADGSDVTLDDVLFGWELARAGHLGMNFTYDSFSRVSDVERLDDRRFCVHFKDAHYAVLRVVGETWLVAKKQFFVDRVAALCAPEPAPAVDSAEFARAFAKIDRECGPGTGPYRLDNEVAGVRAWRPHQDVLLVANPHSWKRAASPGVWTFTGMRVLFRDTQDAQTNALLDGEIDWFVSPTLDELVAARPELLRDYRQLNFDYDALGIYRVVWACQRAPTDDVRVRRALGMLFDFESLRAGLTGIGARALAHAKPGSAAYPRDLQPLPFDPAAARRLLREAGYDREQGRPLKLVLIAAQGNDVLDRAATLFAEAAKQAGIELDLRRRPYRALVEEKKRGDWNGYLLLQSFRAWGDPWDFVHSKSTENDGGWSNAEVDRLADAARVEQDADRRAELWREMHTIVYHEQPAALLAHPLVTMLLHRRIQGTTIGRSGLVLERAFVAPEQQRR